MIRIYTGAHIAFVADAQAVWNWTAICNLPSHPMGLPLLSLAPDLTISPNGTRKPKMAAAIGFGN